MTTTTTNAPTPVLLPIAAKGGNLDSPKMNPIAAPPPPESFKQLNARMHRATQARTAATQRHTAQLKLQAAARNAPLPGFVSVPSTRTSPRLPAAAGSWLWLPAIAISALFLWSFFSKSVKELRDDLRKSKNK